MNKIETIIKDPKALAFIIDCIRSTPLAMADPKFALAMAIVETMIRHYEESKKEREADDVARTKVD